MAGVTPAGFVPKTIDEIIADVVADLRGPSGIDPAIDTSPAQPLGQIIGALAKPVAETWEVGQAVANALNPNAAEGVLLENVCSITGTMKAGATYSLVTATLNLGASKTVPAGSIAAVLGQPNNRWILVGPPDAHGIAVPGSVVSTTSGNYPGVFRSENTGPLVANAGTLTTIVTPVAGWNSVTNALDAALGQLTESDTHLRQKRRAELAAAGSTTPDAMRADLLQLTGMVEAKIYENTSRFVTDADGRPPGAIEAIIHDGVTPAVSDQDIAKAVWTNKAAGAALFGLTTTATYTDAVGVVHAVPFTRAAVAQVSVAITVQIDSTLFPSDGVAQIKAAIVAKGAQVSRVGGTAYPLTFQAYVLGPVPGIANITAYLHGRTAGGGAVLSTPLVATSREIFHFDTANIAVTVA